MGNSLPSLFFSWVDGNIFHGEGALFCPSKDLSRVLFFLFCGRRLFFSFPSFRGNYVSLGVCRFFAFFPPSFPASYYLLVFLPTNSFSLVLFLSRLSFRILTPSGVQRRERDPFPDFFVFAGKTSVFFEVILPLFLYFAFLFPS